MLLADLGAPSEGRDVLATDIDREALAAAAHGAYPTSVVEELPESLRARYLDEERGAPAPYRIRSAVRERVELRVHDLATGGAPAGSGPFDLVACRNTLIYFQPQLQGRVLALLEGSLAPGGLLWLGEAEWPSGATAERLVVVDRQARLFRVAARRADG
jgi:chemotaxis methyl-accepting protein methylase